MSLKQNQNTVVYVKYVPEDTRVKIMYGFDKIDRIYFEVEWTDSIGEYIFHNTNK